MSKFHDCLLTDNQQVFFNVEEFAKSVSWNGYTIIVTDETPSESLQFTHGVEQATIIYRVAKTVLTKPRNNERVNIDDELWLVRSVQDQLNDFVIRLERLED